MKLFLEFSIAYLAGIAFCCAQFDDNKTFYERKDGGVTVVDPDRNIYGNTDYKVRSYDSRSSAYNNEYAAENLALQAGGAVAIGAINVIIDAGHSLSQWYKEYSRPPNYNQVYTNTNHRPLTDEERIKLLNTRY